MKEMKSVKIYLSDDCVKHLMESIDYGAAQSQEEREGLYRIMGDLGWSSDHRDERGCLEIKRETLDWVLSELDWYCTRYHGLRRNLENIVRWS